MKKVKCEICGEYVLQSEMSKSYRHRCKKCVARLTRENRHAAKTNAENLHNPSRTANGAATRIMSEKEFDETIRLAVETYGKESQIQMLFEEMAELQDALCKLARGRHTADHVCEEIADVMIMCFQMAKIFGSLKVEQWTNLKMVRLANKLKGGEQ